MADRFEALKRAHKDGDSLNKFWDMRQPVCPHCAHEIDLGNSDMNHVYEEGDHEISCPGCGEDYTVSTRITYGFSTDDLPADEENDESRRDELEAGEVL
jgi:hypothetical protein